MKKVTLAISVLVLTSLFLTACAPKAVEPVESGEQTTCPVCAECPAPTECPTTNILDLGGKTITVAVENQYPPFNSIDEATGEGVGWDYDAFREICNRINCVVEFKQAAWDGIFPAMAAGEYDALADGVTFKAGRNFAVDFSIPYTFVSQQLVVRIDENHTLDEIKSDPSLKIGTQIGTTNFLAAEAFFADKEIQTYSDFPGAILALVAGDIDGVVLDDTAAAGFIKEYTGQLKTAGTVATGDMLAFVFPPGSDLVLSVNAALRAMQADGTLTILNLKWGLAEPAGKELE
jgi:polar amino acid transport system substrate-binding protein